MDWLNYLHVFCMHAAHTGALDVDALSNENIEVLRQELLVPVDCSKLGEYAVVVKGIAGFIKRVEAAVKAKGYEGRCGLVKYYDPETFHGSFRETESVFRKQVTQEPDAQKSPARILGGGSPTVSDHDHPDRV